MTPLHPIGILSKVISSNFGDFPDVPVQASCIYEDGSVASPGMPGRMCPAKHVTCVPPVNRLRHILIEACHTSPDSPLVVQSMGLRSINSRPPRHSHPRSAPASILALKDCSAVAQLRLELYIAT